ncbi:MAG: ComEC/Rec2 family competence protein, partial [Verrucomicrobia bacterium]|nr:ComEC/Rec2 family competence protein [Verrucomicrobiota bacterium]
GQFDERTYDLRHGLIAELRVRETVLLQADAWNLAAWLDHRSQQCREWVKGTLSIGMRGDEDAHRIVVATVLGGAEAEARDLEQPFRVTGTLHIFAVSGLHVGIVGWILWRLFKPLGLSRGWTALIVSLLLFGYAFLTGLRPSTVRAAVMAVVLLSGELWQRRSEMLNSLGAAALILLTLDSNQLYSIGFQFSFGVITAIALFNRPILGLMRPLTQPDNFMPEVLLSSVQHFALGVRRWLAAAIAISTVSWIGSLPFTVRHFHLATPIALVANIFLVPIAFLILFTTILTFAATLVHLPFVPLWLGSANWFFARAAIFLAQAFAMIPGGNFYLDLPAVRLRPPAELTVLRLRAGGGAQHLRTLSSDWLFDCGSVKDYDFLLRSYLNQAAVNHLHGLVLSHADTEHIGGAPFIVRDYHPDRILLSALETSSRSSSLRKLRDMNVQPGKLSLGDQLDFGGVSFSASAEVIFPPSTLRAAHADDRTTMLRLDLGRFKILWCNDAGFTAEKYIVEKLPPEAARCDVLIRNQHANDTSLTPEFLDRAHPRLVISASNTFPESQKLPQRIRDECAARKIILLDQASTGAVTLRIWPQRLEVVPFRGPIAPITLGPRQSDAH